MNSSLISKFEVLRDYYQSANDKGRTIAYNNALTALKAVHKPITTISQVKNLQGIGPTMQRRIHEFLETGTIRVADEKSQEMGKLLKDTKKELIVQNLQTVWGVGKSKAIELYNAGIRSVSDLKKDPSLLSRQQRIGLAYYKDLSRKVPRSEITALESMIRSVLDRKYTGKYTMVVAGSYRRGAKESNDMDVVITSDYFNLAKVVKMLRDAGVVVDTLSMRDQKFMGVVKNPFTGRNVRLDMVFVSGSEWATGLLYFTGSKGFNITMRSIAKRKGYLLNEHALIRRKSGRRVRVEREEDVFRELGMDWVPPERR